MILRTVCLLPFSSPPSPPPAIANETKEVVQKEEQEATVKAQKTQEIADSAQRDLDEALPALVSHCTVESH